MRKFLALLLSGALILSSVTIQNVYATDKSTVSFILTDEEGSELSDTINTFSVYSDQDLSQVVEGSFVQNKNVVVFTAENALSDKEYYYTIQMEGYEDTNGSFTFSNDMSPVPVTLTAISTIVSASFTVVDDLGFAVDISDFTFSIYKDSNHRTEIDGTCTVSGNTILFVPDNELEEVTYYYTLNIPGYEELNSSFPFKKNDPAVSVTITKIIVSQLLSFYLKNQLMENAIFSLYRDAEMSDVIINDFVAASGRSTIDLPRDINRGDTIYCKFSDERYQLTRSSFSAGENTRFTVVVAECGPVSFVDANGETISGTISFMDEDGRDVSFTQTADSYSFPNSMVGDEVFFTIKKEDYFDYKSSFVLTKDTQTILINLTPLESPLLMCCDFEFTYRDPSVDLSDYISFDPKYDGTILYSIESGDEVIDLNGKIVTPLKVGTATIKITAERTDNYLPQSIVITISVKPFDLGSLCASDFTWSETTKSYDGTANFVLKALYSGDALLPGEELKITANAVSSSKDVGDHLSTIQDIQIESGDNYVFTFDSQDAGPSVNITMLMLSGTAAPLTFAYGSSEWMELQNNTYRFAVKDVLDFGLSSDILIAEVSAFLTKFVQYTIEEKKYYVGIHSGAIVFKNNAHLTQNFSILDIEPADIIIEVPHQDDVLWSYVAIDESLSKRVFVKEGTIYVAEDGLAVFKVVNTQLYDSIAIKNNNRYSDRLRGSDISNVSSFYLYLKDHPETRSDGDESKVGAQDNSIPDNALRLDDEAPKAEISFLGKSYSVLSNEAAFSVNEKQSVIVSISAEDTISGIRSIQYYLYNVSGQTSRTIDIPTGDEMENFAWISYNKEISIDSGSQYVVYARIEDNVGNVTFVNCSEVISVEGDAPELTISGIEKDKIYNTNVSVTMSAIDLPDVNSAGLRSISYKIIKDGSFVTQEETFDLSQSFVKSWEKTITIDAAQNNSNDVVIELSSEDMAGNTSSTKINVIIDVTVPEIDVDYAGNNGCHNTTQELLISVKERNLQQIVFSLAVDGVKGIYTFNELSNIDGISVSDMKISGEGDETTRTFSINFGTSSDTDHDYEMTVSVEDKAGNSTKSDLYSFTIDKVAPALSVEFYLGSNLVAAGNSLADRRYYDNTITVKMKVSDRNMAQNSLVINGTGMDAEGNVARNWQESVNTNANGEYSFSLSEDANYEISGWYTDLAGNRVSAPAMYITVDKTGPEGVLTLVLDGESRNYVGMDGNMPYNLFTQGSVTVSAAGSDKVSGIRDIAYYVHKPAEESGNVAALNLTQLAALTWTDGSSIKLEDERQCVVYMRLRDMSGNITYLATNDAFIIDRTSPTTVEITLENEKAFYNTNVPFTISVSDAVSGGTYSGIKSVTYEVVNNGEVTQSVVIGSEKFSRSSRTLSASFSDIVDGTKNNSNNVLIRATVEDYAGNITTAEKTIKIDTAAPIIEASYSNNKVQNEIYYDASRVLTIRVYERNFNPETFSLSITGTGTPSIGTWSSQSDSVNPDRSVSTLTVTFIDDGVYTVNLSYTDPANNAANTINENHFVIDKTMPVITVSFDNTDVKNEMYYNAKRTATITITEKNFLRKNVSIKIRSDSDERELEPIFTDSLDKHEIHVDFTEEGKYSLIIDCSDQAGNPAQTVVVDTFIIDMTPPELDITGLEQNSSYNGSVEPVISFMDTNPGENKVLVFIKGLRHSETTPDGTLVITDNGGQLLLADFAEEKEQDDRYILSASFTDLAGNTTTKEITFTINRYGSSYELRESADSLNRFYIFDTDNISVYENNVNRLSDLIISIGRNGNLIDVEKGKDYFVTEEETQNGYTYRYEISKSVFGQEGIYEIVISSTDEAGNSQTNSLKGVPISFAIDRTAPICFISGIDDGGRYNDTAKIITVATQDEIATGSIDVFVNGTLFKSFSQEEVRYSNGQVDVTLSASDDIQRIYAVAKDAAGNITQTEEIQFLLTTNGWIRFYRNTPLFVGTLSGTGLVLAGGIFLLIKKKKKEEATVHEGKTTTGEL